MKKTLYLAGGLLFYQFIVIVLKNTSGLPSLQEIVKAIVNNFSHIEIYQHIIASLSRVIIGVFVATIVGVSLGLFTAHFEKIRFLTMYIDILKPIPPIAWIPIAIILFGLSEISSYFIVFIGAFFPIFSNTYYGAKSIPVIYKNCALSFDLSPRTYFMKILLPYTLPYIISGIKIGIGMGWMSVIAAELIGAQSGLGYYIQLNRLILQSDNVIVGMLTIGIVGYGLQKIVEKLESKLLAWK
jgi:NitT/TauT family transport system permease protein/sulfonate transport system permease protein